MELGLGRDDRKGGGSSREGARGGAKGGGVVVAGGGRVRDMTVGCLSQPPGSLVGDFDCLRTCPSSRQADDKCRGNLGFLEDLRCPRRDVDVT